MVRPILALTAALSVASIGLAGDLVTPPVFVGAGLNGTPAPLTPPQTRAPMGGLILGAGNPATPTGKGGHCEPEDETGLPGHERPVGHCDGGAYQTPPG